MDDSKVVEWPFVAKLALGLVSSLLMVIVMGFAWWATRTTDTLDKIQSTMVRADSTSASTAAVVDRDTRALDILAGQLHEIDSRLTHTADKADELEHRINDMQTNQNEKALRAEHRRGQAALKREEQHGEAVARILTDKLVEQVGHAEK